MMKKTAYINAIILDGTENMKPQKDRVLIVNEGKITDIISKKEWKPDGDTEVVDLNGKYLAPGLINLHVHLPGNGSASKKPRDNKKLVQTLMSHKLTRKIVKDLCAKYASIELYSGVTTIRCVGGIEDFDSQIRDEINSGKRIGPRMLVANTAITVAGGHMEGSVARAVKTPKEARKMVQKTAKQNPDLIKLMITGGVLDGTVMGEPGQLKMSADIVKAACEEAHKLGYSVAAHVEGKEGLKIALENGVDTIEHGAEPDEEILSLFKKHHAALVTTISPAIPFAKFDPKDSYATEMGQVNGKIVMDGIVSCSKAALENGIPVGLGNDVGCPFITQYDFYRELKFFTKYCDVSNRFALYTATLGNAKIAGIDGETGSIEKGKSADFIVMKRNPLKNLMALGKISGVCYKGNYIYQPLKKIKKKKHIEELFNNIK